METKKKQLAQYFTTNCDYIFSDFNLDNKKYNFIEPFCGAKDLVNWIRSKEGLEDVSVEMYDLDPQTEDIVKQDTLLNPPEYKGKYVVTNPPFLARNKNKDKALYDKYEANDLYKIFVKTIVEGEVEGGVIILPLNFICAQESTIRNLFFSNYSITKLNIFEETVFKDTTYTICSFMFTKGKQKAKIPTTIFPSKKKIDLELRSEWSWRPAGFLYEPRNKNNPYKIDRLVAPAEQEMLNLINEVGDVITSCLGDQEREKAQKFLTKLNTKSENLKKTIQAKKTVIQKKTNITNLYLRAVDSGTQNNRIGLEIKKEPFYGKLSDRVFATLTCNEKISNEEKVVKEFNERFEKLRKENNSLFLTNYRNSTSVYARKRASFRMCYIIIENIIFEMNNKQNKENQ
tara:strand:+ start:1316 stop:2518 length:1203 start_codon:yes stop_codon:yes gene_type:complete